MKHNLIAGTAQFAASGLINPAKAIAQSRDEQELRQHVSVRERMFRKLEVRFRAEMIAQLSSNKLFSLRDKAV